MYIKKLIISLALLLSFSFLSFSQVGQKIKTKYYTSFYDSANGQPTLVIYKLYKAPLKSVCSRESMRFHKDSLCDVTASNSDYAGSGYDIGHMCDAEDMSFDCAAEEATFRFYNATPQSPANNRGTWKHFENLVRKYSQDDSILILCGPIFDDSLKKIKTGSHLTVPKRDFKIVQSLTYPNICYLIFTVDQNGSSENVTIQQLSAWLGFDIDKYMKH